MWTQYRPQHFATLIMGTPQQGLMIFQKLVFGLGFRVYHDISRSGNFALMVTHPMSL